MIATPQSLEVRENVDLWLRMYRQMLAIRLFEEQVNELYTRALMPGLAHLYIGEEAVAVGVCEALERDDYITSTHRGHGHCLAKGASPDLMFAELLGKEAGYCKGKGGSMHIADPATGNLGANAIVGGSAGIATGAAFSAKRLGTEGVAVCFFGEGALGQGVLYEVMNLASYGSCRSSMCARTISTTSTRTTRKRRPATCWRGPTAFGLEAVAVDGQDVRAVYELPKAGRAGARAEPVRPFCSAIPTAITATTWATSTANTTAPSRKSSVEDGARSDSQITGNG